MKTVSLLSLFVLTACASSPAPPAADTAQQPFPDIGGQRVMLLPVQQVVPAISPPATADTTRPVRALSGESLRRGAESTFATLMHEAAHAKAYNTGVKDTSRNNVYHNSRFKEIGEGLGLVITQDIRRGWTITELSKETKRSYTKEITAIRQALKTYRFGAHEIATKPRQRRTQLLQTESGRTLRVPLTFLEGGGIFDENTGERFVPVEDAQ